ncbi:MAG: glycosyltransferase [Elusimicrobia bacterium]|jgi:4,4'-diaponeurosporenoate glycosyltransferase|nr:glycosyltransferase [Elusimicrobiota bacterium]MBK7545279.1 glycosyltransferase [Elusimicrobiota bacterium]MBK7575707.1 glycosyltransferase [Elusimicrobiota bacterium]MBK7688627.1 glycosyltransferase [Elusimicrobiota bacterium]MBK8126940.1 glycosyltransferase [Elusimicrobiota bacterium]
MLEATLHGLCWLAGFWMLWRLAALPKGDAAVDFSVIIPARDEARRLPALLESLQNQSLRPLEILVVDDHSTDGTTDVARRVGARVIASAPLPAGWRGKTWACQQGAREARGPWLLFLDADLRLLPGALARIAAAARANRGAVSVLPYHRTVRWVEDFSGVFNLVQAAASNAFTPRGNRAAPQRLFGPLLAVSRETFWSVGGYEPVKDRWVENFDLSAVLEGRGEPLACYAGKGAVEFRMYDSGIAGIAAGWGKSFVLGGKGTPLSIWIAFSLWLTGALGAARALAAAACSVDAPVLLSGAVYALFALQTGLWLRRLGSFRWATALAYPVPAVFFVFVFLRSLFALAVGRPLVWKGRTNQ